MNGVDPKLSAINPVTETKVETCATTEKTQEVVQNAFDDFLVLLPSELIQKIGSELTLGGLASLGRQNTVGKDNADYLILKRAKHLGYNGANAAGAKKYLQALFNEVSSACEDGLISEQYRARKGDDTVDAEVVLGNLLRLNLTDTLQFFSKKGAYSEDLKRLRRLLIQHAENQPIAGVNLNIQTDETDPLLHLSVRFEELSLLNLLLRLNPDLDLVNKNGETALMISIRKKTDRITLMLLAHPMDLDKADVEGFTALHFAVQNKDLKLVRLLLEKGADPTAQTNDGRTPMVLAEGNAEMQSLIQEHIDNLD